MSISIDKALGVHQPALLLRSERAGLLAENIANADTPNYKARDFDFREALSLATGAGEGLRVTHPRHLDQSGGGSMPVEPSYRVPDQPSVDGNTVDSQREKAAFVDNALRYQASLTFLGSKIQTLRSALKGEG